MTDKSTSIIESSQGVDMDFNDKNVKNCPETSLCMFICFPLRCLFVWIIPYIFYFFFKPATLKMLPRLDKSNKVEEIDGKFDVLWNICSKNRNKEYGSNTQKFLQMVFSLPVNVCSFCCCCCCKVLPGMKLFFILCALFRFEYWISIISMLLARIGMVFVPKLLQNFLEHLSPLLENDTKDYLSFSRKVLPSHLSPKRDSELGFRTNDVDIWYYLFSLVIVQTLSLILLEWSIHVAIKESMRSRTVLQSRIFLKSLRLSSKSRTGYDNGSIINLSTLDLGKIEQGIRYIDYGFCASFQVFGSLYFIIDLLDWGALTSSITLFVFLPSVCFLMSIYVFIVTLTKKVADRRLSTIYEVLQGIRIIKFFTWEDPYTEKISKLRKKETIALRGSYAIYSILSSFFASMSSILCIVAFVTYYYVHDDLPVVVVFTSLTYFLMLKDPLMITPLSIAVVVDMFASLGRLEKFFESEELVDRKKDEIEDFGKSDIELKREVEEEEINNTTSDEESQNMDEESEDDSEEDIIDEDLEIETSEKKLEMDIFAPDSPIQIRNAAFLWDSIPESKVIMKKLFGKEKIDESLPPTPHDEKKKEEIKIDSPSKNGSLRNINFFAPNKSLTMICGGIGSGKSNLLSAILGEMKQEEGTIKIRGKYGFTSQTSWILNATLKENILFGDIYDEKRFKEVCRVCALDRDINELPGNENIEIGEKGINLSGGQKYRVSIARACYKKDTDILLFDDPLSAVDSHVGAHLMEECILKYLDGKTRIVVTHQIQYLEKADWIVFMKDGQIAEQGRYEDLIEKNEEGLVYHFIKNYLEREEDDDDNEEEEEIEVDQESSEESESSKSDNKGISKLIKKEEKESGVFISPKVFLLYFQSMGFCYGIIPCLTIFIATFIAQIFLSGSSMYLAEWSRGSILEEFDNYYTTHIYFRNATKNSTLAFGIQDPPSVVDLLKDNDRMLLFSFMKTNSEFKYFDIKENQYCPESGNCYTIRRNVEIGWDDTYKGETKTKRGLTNIQAVLLFASFGVFGYFTGCIRDFLLVNFGLSANSAIFLKATRNLIRAPMSFFDTSPKGRIINRFSSDVQSIDGAMLISMSYVNTMAWQSLFDMIIIGYLTRGLGLVFVFPVLILYILFYLFYRRTNLELRRLYIITKSPILSLLSETLDGLSTIRAYGAQDRFHKRFQRYININNRAFFLRTASERWMGTNLALLGSFLVSTISSIAVISWYYTSWDIDVSYLGLAVTLSMIVPYYLWYLSEHSTITEIEFNSVERLSEYSNKIPQEPQRKIEFKDDELGKKKWPKLGTIKFSDFSLRYRNGLPLVLNNLNLSIENGEKIGLIGRTGSGKSTLGLSLFRFIEASEGKIEIDGVDISTLGLDLLRSSISIIPQDPVLFSGTIRSNIDPFKLYSDDECLESLEKSRMKKIILKRHKGLYAEVREGGENFSVGERQLICLTRAMLKKNKILVLDECTASIDLELDEFIQQQIKDVFRDCTVLTIAHRINTIIDYDKVLVLDKGVVSQFDSPKNLLIDQPEGIFRMLIRETGKKNEGFLMDAILRNEENSETSDDDNEENNVDRLCDTSSQEESTDESTMSTEEVN